MGTVFVIDKLWGGKHYFSYYICCMLIMLVENKDIPIPTIAAAIEWQ